MGRRGNPYDNAKAESFMKTLKVEAVSSRPSPLHRRGLQHPQTPLRARLSEPRAIRGSTRPATCQNRRLKLSTIKGALQQTCRSGKDETHPSVPRASLIFD